MITTGRYDLNTLKITEVDIVINGDMRWNNTGGSEFYDVQNNITHELGHALGLSHSEYEEATMYYGTGLGETSKRTLHQDDINGFHAIYG